MGRLHESGWSVVWWHRYDEEPPVDTGPTGGTVTFGGVVHDLVLRVPDGWKRAHIRHGASITDHERGFTYRATVNPERPGELDYLQVTFEGHIGEGDLRSVPVNRIRDAVVQFLAQRDAALMETGEETLFFVLPGGVQPKDPNLKPGPPPLDQIAQHLRDGLTRQAIAALYKRKELRTVDGWIRRARQEYPNDTPKPTRGRRTDKENKA